MLAKHSPARTLLSFAKIFTLVWATVTTTTTTAHQRALWDEKNLVEKHLFCVSSPWRQAGVHAKLWKFRLQDLAHFPKIHKADESRFMSHKSCLTTHCSQLTADIFISWLSSRFSKTKPSRLKFKSHWTHFYPHFAVPAGTLDTFYCRAVVKAPSKHRQALGIHAHAGGRSPNDNKILPANIYSSAFLPLASTIWGLCDEKEFR